MNFWCTYVSMGGRGQLRGGSESDPWTRKRLKWAIFFFRRSFLGGKCVLRDSFLRRKNILGFNRVKMGSWMIFLLFEFVTWKCDKEFLILVFFSDFEEVKHDKKFEVEFFLSPLSHTVQYSISRAEKRNEIAWIWIRDIRYFPLASFSW